MNAILFFLGEHREYLGRYTDCILVCAEFLSIRPSEKGVLLRGFEPLSRA